MTLAGYCVLAPGIADRADFEAIVRGAARGPELPQVRPETLSPRERRRAPATVCWALAAAEAACADAGVAPADTQAVFASSMGDLALVDRICRTLASAPAALSPTHFHNSVHNAPAGYWTIGAGATADTTALSAHEDSVLAALVEVAARAVQARGPILLLAYDMPGPPPTTDFCDTAERFAAAAVLRPGRHAHGIVLQLAPASGAGTDVALPAALQALVEANPSARVLPLLALALAPPGSSVTLRPRRGMALQVTRT